MNTAPLRATPHAPTHTGATGVRSGVRSVVRSGVPLSTDDDAPDGTAPDGFACLLAALTTACPAAATVSFADAAPSPSRGPDATATPTVAPAAAHEVPPHLPVRLGPPNFALPEQPSASAHDVTAGGGAGSPVAADPPGLRAVRLAAPATFTPATTSVAGTSSGPAAGPASANAAPVGARVGVPVTVVTGNGIAPAVEPTNGGRHLGALELATGRLRDSSADDPAPSPAPPTAQPPVATPGPADNVQMPAPVLPATAPTTLPTSPPTGTTPDTGPTRHVRPALIEATRHLRQEGGRTSLVIRLDPPELGAVLVRLTVRDGLVDVQLRTPDLASRSDLQAQSFDVQQVLREQGLDLSSFDVAHGDVLPGGAWPGSPDDRATPDRATPQRPRGADGQPGSHVTDDVPSPQPAGTWL